MRSIKVKKHDKYVRAIFITQKEMNAISLLGGTSRTQREANLNKLFPYKALSHEKTSDLSNVLAKLFYSVGDSHNDPDSEDMIVYAERGEV